VEDLNDRVKKLEDFRRDAEGRLGKLETSVALIDARVTAIEAWQKTVEKRLADLTKRIEEMEKFLADKGMSEADQKRVLEQFSPVFKFDAGGSDSGPIINPTDFAEGCFIGDTGTSNTVWHASDLAEWLTKDEGNSRSSAWREMQPLKWRNETHDGLVWNQQAIQSGRGIFGHARKLKGEHRYSVKYFIFLAWNETHFPGGEGNHEGDWGCIDLQVKETFNPGAEASFEVLYAIYHHHGKQTITVDFDKTEDGRPVVYLERGTNESHPKPGDDDYFDAVRPHDGRGLAYDTRGFVRNLNTVKDVDCDLVRSYRGQWGEIDIDNAKSVPWIGQDVTNPPGPPWQEKMWLRSFSSNPDDPIVSK
jgi:hypothetical protein